MNMHSPIKTLILALGFSLTGITTPATAGEITTTTVTDAAGAVEVLTFEENLGIRRLISEVHQDGQTKTREYDANNNLTARVDELGRRQESTYNSNNQRVSRTEAAGTPQARTTTTTYLSNDLDLPTQISRPSVAPGQQAITTITYDVSSNPVSITQSGFAPAGTPVSRTTQITYNNLGQVTQLNGPRSDVSDITTFTYNVCTIGGGCGQLASTSNALGQTTTYGRYDANGRVLQSTDANGTVTTSIYDSRGRLTSQTTTSAGSSRTTAYTYDLVGQLIQVIDPVGLVLSYDYDAAHDLRSVTDSLGNKIAYGYDIKGNRTSTNTSDPDGTLVRTVQTVYDLRNRVSQINAAGSITDQVRNAVGQLTTETDPNRNPDTTHQYDALDRLTQTLGALGNPTGYNYDDQDNLAMVTAPNGAITTYSYDDLGNQLTETSSDRGTLNYTHDTAGNVLSLTDARGIIRNYTYDVLNRLTDMTYPDADENVTYLYDSCSNGAGRLCEVSDPTGATSFSYDGFGNIATETKIIEGVTYVTEYEYDKADRVTALITPDGRRIEYERDSLGRVTAVRSTVNDVLINLSTNRTHRADGLLTGQTFGNGLAETRSYDEQGRMQTQNLAASQSRLYSYDANGNMTGRNVDGSNTTFNYDVLDRLDEELATSLHDILGYDPNGNRLSQITNGDSSSYAYTANSNRLTDINGETIDRDAAGNMLSDKNGSRTFTNNDAGRLEEVEENSSVVAHYVYDYQNRRVLNTEKKGTTVYHYDLAGQLLAETDTAGRLIRGYAWAEGEPILQAMVPGARTIQLPGNNGKGAVNGNNCKQNKKVQIAYLHTDHLLTARLATDEVGTVLWQWDSSAFGVGSPNEDVDGDGNFLIVNLRFPGQYYDQETELYYNWNRYYDPGTGRYITADPVGQLNDINLFAYVHSRPTYSIDPLGLGETGAAIGAAIGGTAGTIAGGIAGGAAAGTACSPSVIGILPCGAAGAAAGAAKGGIEGTIIGAIIGSTVEDFIDNICLSSSSERTCRLIMQRPSTKVSWVPSGQVQCTWECTDSFGTTKFTRLLDGDTCPDVPDGELVPGGHGF